MSVEPPSYALPEEYHQALLTAFLKAAGPRGYEIMHAGAARVYNRKGFDATDTLGADRNRSYSTPDDDYVITVTLRVSRDVAMTNGLRSLERQLLDARERELMELVAQRQQEFSDAQHQLDALRQRKGGPR